MLLTNEGEMMKNDNTKKEFTIRITTLIVTFFLCLFAGYSAFVSRGVAKMMAEEYTIRMRPSLIPSVEKVTYISTGEMLIELSIKNHGNTDVNLEETKIIEIDLPTYVDSLKIKIIEEEQLHLGSRYLPNTGKSYYFFKINNVLLESLKKSEVAILVNSHFTCYNDNQLILNYLLIYNEFVDSIVIHKLWIEEI